MEYRSLGRTGVQVSRLCLGTANFGNPIYEKEARQIMQAALDAGMPADDGLRAAFDELNPPGMAVSNFHNTSGWMKAVVPTE